MIRKLLFLAIFFSSFFVFSSFFIKPALAACSPGQQQCIGNTVYGCHNVGTPPVGVWDNTRTPPIAGVDCAARTPTQVCVLSAGPGTAKCALPGGSTCIPANCQNENGGTGCHAPYTCTGTAPDSCTCNSGAATDTCQPAGGHCATASPGTSPCAAYPGTTTSLTLTCAAGTNATCCQNSCQVKGGSCFSGSCSDTAGYSTVPGTSAADCLSVGSNYQCCAPTAASPAPAGPPNGAIVPITAPPPPPPPCSSGDNVSASCPTAVGDLPTDVAGFIKTFFGIILGLSGAIALLLIIVAGYRLMISRGNPENLQNAREQLTAAIVGLLFVIFAFVILQVIGVNILGISSFGQ